MEIIETPSQHYATILPLDLDSFFAHVSIKSETALQSRTRIKVKTDESRQTSLKQRRDVTPNDDNDDDEDDELKKYMLFKFTNHSGKVRSKIRVAERECLLCPVWAASAMLGVKNVRL